MMGEPSAKETVEVGQKRVREDESVRAGKKAGAATAGKEAGAATEQVTEMVEEEEASSTARTPARRQVEAPKSASELRAQLDDALAVMRQLKSQSKMLWQEKDSTEQVIRELESSLRVEQETNKIFRERNQELARLYEEAKA
jgi:CRISPR/Cas system CMR-associated protein Cmr1 (group 7 of RAMP superfamily)